MIRVVRYLPVPYFFRMGAVYKRNGSKRFYFSNRCSLRKRHINHLSRQHREDVFSWYRRKVLAEIFAVSIFPHA